MSSAQMRKDWSDFECAEIEMERIDFGPDRIHVAPPTIEAWNALATVLLAHDYDIRTSDTDSYNCREIKGGKKRSLHSYGIALDVNWHTNPFKKHGNERKVRYSNKTSQAARATDVKLGLADTDMTPDMIADVRAIKNNAGQTVFEWGGDWRTMKDAMHFQIDLSPEELALGIDEDTVRQPGDPMTPAPLQPALKRYVVTARNGLRMRAGPGTEFDIIRVAPHGWSVFVQSFDGPWALVDLVNDGAVDGYMHGGFLRPA